MYMKKNTVVKRKTQSKTFKLYMYTILEVLKEIFSLDLFIQYLCIH